MSFFSKIFGDENAREIKALLPVVASINALEPSIHALSDDALRAKTDAFKKRHHEGEALDDLLPEVFAVVREAAERTLGQRHFDVQLMGGIALHRGMISEMRTGEGKTLVATLPAYLNALSGKGVHIVTVNDYLSRRDAVWMGQVYAFLGLSVGVINSQNQSFLYDPAHTDADTTRDALGSFKVVYEFLRPASKRDAYAADVTYGTNNEYGFDYLRDNTAYEIKDLAQRSFHYAIVDEIDSILIDEARTPLIISMATTESEDLYGRFAGIAARLTKEEDYTVDEKHHAIALTDTGIEKAERALGIGNIYTDAGIKYVHHLETAVRAQALYRREKEYVVRDGEVVIVDEFTGRLQPGRRWSEGLHQAIEAKEGVPVQKESRTAASVTFQNYFRQYKKLSGMTGTAATSAEEFHKVYGLRTLSIPTHRPSVRIDRNDLIFRTEEGKWSAVVARVKELHESGQPVLIGTVSIEKNEVLSERLSRAGISHEVLNAKNHEREGEITAQSGAFGKVTVATNMAGRGVDIKLGGTPGTSEAYEKIKTLGGLHVIGTERHEARRIDNQLRGRAGRQGDPGETQFFVSFEDSLMRIFAADTVKNMMVRLNIPEDQAIENPLINKSLEAAQRKIEGLNFDARKYVLEYDDVMNYQRQIVYERRRTVLLGDVKAVRVLLDEILGDDETLKGVVQERGSTLGEQVFIETVRRLILQTTDVFWMEHLESMEYLRGSVRLRAYGQRDPLVEYKREGLQLFKHMQESVNDQIRLLLPTIAAGAFAHEEERLKGEHERMKTIGGDTSVSAYPIVNTGETIGRNDPCPCGAINSATGKVYKWKQCGMINAPHHAGKKPAP